MKNNIKKVLYNYKNFGLRYGMSFLLTKTIFRGFEYKTRKKAINILDKKFGNIFDTYASEPIPSNKFDKNIFVFWAQGQQKMPEIPSEAFRRLKELYTDYKIIFIDLNNYSDYVKLDENIVRLFNKGNISIQTFSDILRFQLIYLYGGVWCDATILFYEKFDFESTIQGNVFYSLNIDCAEKTKLWGKVYPITYTTFLFWACKGSNILASINKAYIEYYNKYDFVIDYFLNDYFFILAMKHRIDNSALEKIGKQQGNPFYLLNKINDGYIEVDINECKKCPQKLTWKNLTLKNIAYYG